MPDIEIIPAGVSLGGGPRCWGMMLLDERTKRTDRIECTEPATWRKVIDHCGHRERFLCSEHRKIDLQIMSRCRACGTPIETEWERI
jgi:hypothetical protein